MLSFLFLIIIVAAVSTSYYFTNKIAVQRKQILLLKYQNSDLKQNSKTNKDKKTFVKYMLPTSTKGLIKEKCELLICPIDNSAVLSPLQEDTLVKIEDSANINSHLWYEISLITEERINSKGWVKEDFIILKEDTDE
jgi:hypothetical protein